MRGTAPLDMSAGHHRESLAPAPDAHISSAPTPTFMQASPLDASFRREHGTSIDTRSSDRSPRTLVEHTTTSVARIERPPVQIAPPTAADEAGSATQATQTVVQAPTPLLGPVTAEVPRNPVAARAQVPSTSAAAREPDSEPTEVHVHIGRIEVTAVHAPALVKRRASATRQTQSLTDYLARRRPS